MRGRLTLHRGYRLDGQPFTYWRADVVNTSTGESVWHDDGWHGWAEAFRDAEAMTECARIAYWHGFAAKRLRR